MESSLLLLAEVGIGGAPALVALYGAAVWDLALGVVLLGRLRPVLVGASQLATMTALILIITALLPETWLHPFGPATKNVPLAWATLVPVVWLQLRALPRQRSPRASHCRIATINARSWFWLGWPAFGAVLAIFCLMVFRKV